MTSDSDSQLMETLADDFAQRLRRGETPSIAEYEKAHPSCARQIRQLFPSILLIEQAAKRRERERARPRSRHPWPERLGDFRLIREIGRGGMGVVFEAEQQSLGRQVALKVFSRDPLSDERHLKRFRREARTAARLHHTNIVPVLGVGHQRGYHYYVMQYVPGVGLDAIVNELWRIRSADHESPGEPEHKTASSAGQSAAALTRIARAMITGRFAQPRSPASTTSLPTTDELSAVEDGDLQTLPAAAAFPACADGGNSVGEGESNEGDDEAPSLRENERSRFDGHYWQSVARIGVEAADALHYAHGQGTLHRDIKPANLLLDAQGTTWVTDFGLAKSVEHETLSRTGDIVGTLRYMAPERFSGRADARSDIYSLGLTLYELLVLRPAFEKTDPNSLIQTVTHDRPTPPRQLCPAVPRDLETIVLKAMAKEPTRRYESAGALANDLQRFLEDRPIHARRVGAIERLWRWSRRNRALASLSGTVFVLLVLVAVVASAGYLHTKRASRRVSDANIQVKRALAAESRQRQKAEATSKLAQEALDDLFEQFVPNRISARAGLSFDDADGNPVEMPSEPVLSKEVASLLERMLLYYERLAEQGDDDIQLRKKVADAKRRTGDLHARLGNYEPSQAAYLSAIELYQQLQEQTPEDATIRTELARIHNQLGIVHWDASWPAKARQFHSKALMTLESVPTGPPTVQYELARTHYLLGRAGVDGGGPGPRPILGRKRPPGKPARPGPGAHKPGRPTRLPDGHFQAAVRLLEELVSEHPNVSAYRHLLARCYRDLPRKSSEGQASAGNRGKALAILQQLADEFPSVPDYSYDLLMAYAAVDFQAASLTKSNYHAAEKDLRCAALIAESLVAGHPSVPEYESAQVLIQYTLAEILRRTQRRDAAATALREALQLQSSLADRYPQARSYQTHMAIIQESLAKLLGNQGQLQESRTLLQSSIDVLERLLGIDPKAPQIHDLLVRSHTTLADILTRLQQDELAAQSRSRARDHRARGRALRAP